LDGGLQKNLSIICFPDRKDTTESSWPIDRLLFLAQLTQRVKWVFWHHWAYVCT
jgi:hypothetical protein